MSNDDRLEVWRDCADGHPYINWRLKDGDDCFVCMLLEANAEQGAGLERFAGDIDVLRTALQSLYDATDGAMTIIALPAVRNPLLAARVAAGVVLGGGNDG